MPPYREKGKHFGLKMKNVMLGSSNVVQIWFVM